MSDRFFNLHQDMHFSVYLSILLRKILYTFVVIGWVIASYYIFQVWLSVTAPDSAVLQLQNNANSYMFQQYVFASSVADAIGWIVGLIGVGIIWFPILKIKQLGE